jgi:hypothetical protein
MKYAFTIVLLLLFALAKSQPLQKVDSASIYIDRLSWHSFTIVWNYVPRIALYDDAKRLIAIKDDEKVKKLVRNIGVKEKTVVIHIILSRLCDSSNERVGGSYNYGKDSTIKSVDFSYNGLKWTGDARQENNSITQEEINGIERYWREKYHL